MFCSRFNLLHMHHEEASVTASLAINQSHYVACVHIYTYMYMYMYMYSIAAALGFSVEINRCVKAFGLEGKVAVMAVRCRYM